MLAAALSAKGQPASPVAPHGPLELDRLIETERARSREVLDRLAIPQPSNARSMPSFSVQPGRAPDPGAIAEGYRRSESGDRSSGPELLVFVSFSIPHESLVRLAAQAKQTNGVLVFRGLAGATLREMTARLQPLARTGAAMQINPQAFTRFGVRLVPTFVIAEGGASCADTVCERGARRVAGDVSLDHALERLARQGDALGQAAEARLLLLRASR